MCVATESPKSRMDNVTDNWGIGPCATNNEPSLELSVFCLLLCQLPPLSTQLGRDALHRPPTRYSVQLVAS